jgi:tRNA pseudouridine32 synthase / 23S rRNA pseudouridine746 synthase
MGVLYPLAEFIDLESAQRNMLPSYWYEGKCPRSGECLRLPRTNLAEAIAQGLMDQLSANAALFREGKMYGVLLVETQNGEQRVLKAFSGLLNGKSVVDGWVPAIPGRDRVALEEAQTLAILEDIKQELIRLQQLPIRQHYTDQCLEFDLQFRQLALDHAQRKQTRHEKRQTLPNTHIGTELEVALNQLDQQSQQDGIERRNLKRDRDAQLHPLKQQLQQADAQVQALKQLRKQVSQRLQAQLHAAYSLTNFAGESASLDQLVVNGGLPTGTGDCCAPKLLHYAAIHQLIPLAMAEFWWGASIAQGDKVPGEFYPACMERCQPLMGFLLSGSSPANAQPSDRLYPNQNQSPRSEETAHLLHLLANPLPILYEDEMLIVVNKPAGLLSVPGRTGDRQDSVLSRLQCQLPDGDAIDNEIMAVHRLDQDTSGILLIARNAAAHRHLSQQFEQRQVHKVYEAVLAGEVMQDQGIIDLPLWGDPTNRPYQTVDWQQGKPSITQFRVLARKDHRTRVEFVPLTGRTHQLRVHAASGLGVRILGDRLYGCNDCQTFSDRLHLHAKTLHIQHPYTQQRLTLEADTPF